MERREIDLRRALKTNFTLYAAHALKIRTKHGAVMPFVLNAAQKYIHDKLEAQLAQTGRIRALILKGRQQGCSTYVEGRLYWKVTHRRGVRAFIMTHRDDASRNIHQIARRFHDNCPPMLQPKTSALSAREMTFDLLDSGYRVGTARADGTGRSDTIQYFHGSEVAYWDNAHAHLSGILQAVPYAAGTEIILESTSNGAHGLFYDMCMEAQSSASDYQIILCRGFGKMNIV